MDNITPKQADVVKEMARQDLGRTMTQIGEACGIEHFKASSWAASALKSLMQRGYVTRSVAEDGRILYSLTLTGIRLAQDLMS